MAIQKIQYDWPLDRIWDELVYTAARLKKNKHTKDLAPQLAPLLKRWEKIAAQQRALWTAEIEAQAGVDEGNDDLDDTVGEIDSGLLHHERQKRGARHKRYFKQPANQTIRLGLESELEVVRTWPGSLKTEPEQDLQALGERLADDLDTGDAAVAEKKQAAANTADHRVREIHTFIDDVNNLRLSLFGALATRAAQKKLPASWPARFFRKAPSGGKAKKKTAKGDAPAAATAAAGGDKKK